jgi:NAD(P)-dependent dehydrogenase (short-subunit alcohol dehydrogenase family)
MTPRMDGMVALVSGGASGIGRAVASAFAEEGASVVVADIDVDGGDETVRLLEDRGAKGLFVSTDVSRAADVENLISRTVDTFGGLQYACNCAGVDGELAPTADCTEENWDRTIATDLKGLWLCLRSEIRHMLGAGGGSIVNVASVAGVVGYPGLPAYSAAKGGVVQLTRTAAVEYAAAGIRVNVVAPGAVKTPMLDRLIGRHPELEAGPALPPSPRSDRAARGDRPGSAVALLRPGILRDRPGDQRRRRLDRAVNRSAGGTCSRPAPARAGGAASSAGRPP